MVKPTYQKLTKHDINEYCLRKNLEFYKIVLKYAWRVLFPSGARKVADK